MKASFQIFTVNVIMWLLGLTVAKEEMQENREMYFHI